jgi:hypothetical protein
LILLQVQITGTGAGTGIAGYEPFLQQAVSSFGTAAGDISAAMRNDWATQLINSYMSPYQQDVIDTTLAQFDIQAQKGMQPLAAQVKLQLVHLVKEEVKFKAAEYQSQSDLNRALITKLNYNNKVLVKHNRQQLKHRHNKLL